MKWLLFLFSFFLFSQEVFGFELETQVHPITLVNGMKWFVIYKPGIPVFSGIVVARVGGADEEVGKTGLAHMFEHMAFKGSKKIGSKNFAKEKPLLDQIEKIGQEMGAESQKTEPDLQKIAELRKKIQEIAQQSAQYYVKNVIWDVLTRKGAVDLNAFTTKDLTAYHASMPKEQFPLWADFTSEMVFDPVLREFYQERDVVMEERRLRYDNSPEGFLFEELLKTAFPEGPYHLPPIGEMKDVLSLTATDAQAFHSRHYVPERMVGVLVGAITPAEAEAQLEKTFGRMEKRTPPLEKKAPSFIFQGEKRKIIRFPAEPSLVIAFHKPNAPQREDYVFDMLDSLLCDGPTSRLYRTFVLEKKWASNISCAASFPGSRFENLFIIAVSPNHGFDLEKLETAILEEVDQIKKNVVEEELQKVQADVLYHYYWGLEENLYLAEQVAVAQAVLSDWHYVARYPKVIESITKEEIEKVAQKYFVPENRVVLYRLRGKK